MKKTIIKPEIIESKKAYSNKYMSLREDKVIFKRRDENNELKTLEKTYYILEGGDFVVGIAMKDNKLLIVNQYRLPISGFSNEFVAGILEKNQSPEECMKKEFEEEAGLKVNKMIKLGELNPLIGKVNFCGHIFFTNDFEELETPALEEFEQFTNLTSRWVEMEKMRELIGAGKMKDGVGLAAWALLNEHLKKEV